jgi:hypothetical protein
MKKWIFEHPYASTSTVFMVIIIIGWRLLYWQWENFAFMLLLYFMVTLGIRLDDISKKIGSNSLRSSTLYRDKDSIIGQLNDIKSSLATLNATLVKFLEKSEKKDSID